MYNCDGTRTTQDLQGKVNYTHRPQSALRPQSAQRPQSRQSQQTSLQYCLEQNAYRDPSTLPLITSSPTREIRATDNRRLLQSGTSADVQYVSPTDFQVIRGGRREDHCCPPLLGYEPGQTPPPKGCDCSMRNGLQHDCRFNGILHDCREPRVSNYPYKYPKAEPHPPMVPFCDPCHHAGVACDKCVEVAMPRPCVPANRQGRTLLKPCYNELSRCVEYMQPQQTQGQYMQPQQTQGQYMQPQQTYGQYLEPQELQGQQMRPRQNQEQYMDYQKYQMQYPDMQTFQMPMGDGEEIITLPCPSGLVPMVRPCPGPPSRPIIIQGPKPKPVMVQGEAAPAVMVQCEAPRPIIVQGPTPKPFMVQLPAPRAVMLQYPSPKPLKVQCSPPQPFMLQNKAPKLMMQCP